MSESAAARRPPAPIPPGTALGERLVRSFWNQVIADALPDTDSLRVDGGSASARRPGAGEQAVPLDKEYREHLFEQVVHRAYHLAHDGVDLYPEPVRQVGLTDAELAAVRRLLAAEGGGETELPDDVRDAILAKLTGNEACDAAGNRSPAGRERADGPEAPIAARPSARTPVVPPSRRRRRAAAPVPALAFEGGSM